MAHQVPRDLKGEERLFVIPGIKVPVNKKSIMYNGPASLLAFILGQISGSQLVFISFFIILNVAVYPLGNGRVGKKKFDNGFMSLDKYIKQTMLWKLRGGGNIYIGHKFKGGK